ncbi:MAG: S8 family serine peptidase [Acidobacteria bacterium]|nr:S8 family serine peptidase [Acidobacteriota bacterium]
MIKFIGLLFSALLPLMSQTFTFSDGGKRTRVEFAPNEAYVAVRSGAERKPAIAQVRQSLGSQSKSVIESGDTGFVVTLAGPARTAVQSLRSGKSKVESIRSTAPVFYDSAENPSARRASARRVMTDKLLVKLDNDEQWVALRESTKAQSKKESLIKGWVLVQYADPYAAFDAVEEMTKAGKWEFAPVFARLFEKKQASGTLKRAVNDPLYGNQWHLANEGPGIRMNASWDVATGKGINITVVDDGLDVKHEDLSGNAYPVNSGYHKNYKDGPKDDPSPAKADENHGTACAGLIAATGFNNLGVIGVAPEARLMGLRIIGGESGDDDTAEALAWQPGGLVTHVSSNSWGPADDGKATGRMGPLQAAAIEKAATTYRDGLGTVFCVSAGNGRADGDESSYDEFAGSRFVIGVGAVNKKGEPSSYGEGGINVAISALGGESAPPEMIWTTNNAGDEAHAKLHEDFETSEAPVHYTDAFNGTSAAAPQVSGAAALLLEANPGLGYRDVKEILMRTATRTGLSGGDDFVTNKAGISFSHSFGAGLLNVAAALDAAKEWSNLGPLTSVSLESAEEKAIPDGSINGAVYTFDFSTKPNLRVESVEFKVNVLHKKRSDIGFLLTSPSGMRSIVNNRVPDDGENFEDYGFMSVRHWGEDSTGTWSLRIIDIEGNSVTGRAGDISVKIYGTAK